VLTYIIKEKMLKYIYSCRTVVAKCKASNLIYWPLWCVYAYIYIYISLKELWAVYEAIHLYVYVCNNVVCNTGNYYTKSCICEQHLVQCWIYSCLAKFSALSSIEQDTDIHCQCKSTCQCQYCSKVDMNITCPSSTKMT